jgi:hypothetical protein
MSGEGLSAKKNNMACRLDSEIGTTNTLVAEVVKTTNAIRDALIGNAPSSISSPGVNEKDSPRPGFLENLIGRSEANNRVLNIALDELRIILGEIS